jgi:hypothetical protein
LIITQVFLGKGQFFGLMFVKNRRKLWSKHRPLRRAVVWLCVRCFWNVGILDNHCKPSHGPILRSWVSTAL